MASTSLALPGVLFVGEDERARLVAHLGPAAGWMIPKGVIQWSHEVSIVSRDALTEDVRRDAKIVMPEEQIPPARMPLTHQAALKSPLVGISSKLTQKLVDAGIRVHTIGADRVTSSFYYIAEGGGEDPIRVEGDLVAAVGAMLGERADNAAIERVLDGLVDRLLRSLSRDRVAELSLELAAALPRAAADGTGTQDIDLDAFEKELTALVGGSEKYKAFLQEIAVKIGDTNERKVDIPLFGDARKISQGPFELTVGEQKVALVTHERWLATGPLTEPTKSPAPAPVQTKTEPPPPTPKATTPTAGAVAPDSKPKADIKATTPNPPAQLISSPPAAATAAPANIKPLAAPLNPPRPVSTPPAVTKEAEPAAATAAVPLAATTPAGGIAAPVQPTQAAQPAQPEKPIQTITERPKPAPTPAPEPVVPKAAPVPVVAPTPTPTPTQTPTPTPPSSQPAVVAKATAQQPPQPHVRDPRTATTQKIKRKESGFPWLLILVLAAAAFAGYRFWWMKRSQ